MSIADNDTAEVFVHHGSTIATGDLFVGTGVGTNGSLSISGAGSSVVLPKGAGWGASAALLTMASEHSRSMMATLIAGAGQFYNGMVNINGAGTQLEFESLVLGLGSGELTMILEQLTGSTDPAAVFVGDGRGTFSGSMVGVE